MPKKKPLNGTPTVHKELTGFNIKINEFGQITSNVKVDQLNDFLNEKVQDKKLVDRNDGTNVVAVSYTHLTLPTILLV